MHRKQIGTVGIVENNTSNPYSIPQNCTDNQPNITTESLVKQVKIMDVTGKVVAIENKNKLEITTLKPGIYSITIETENDTHSTKFVTK